MATPFSNLRVRIKKTGAYRHAAANLRSVPLDMNIQPENANRIANTAVYGTNIRVA